MIENNYYACMLRFCLHWYVSFFYCKYETIRVYSSDLKSRLDNKAQSSLFKHMSWTWEEGNN